MNNKTNIKDLYLKHFNETEMNFFGNIRKDAIEKFKAENFPTKKDEEWKYLNIKPLLQKHFVPSQLFGTTAESIDIIDDYMIKDLDAYRFVLVNGIFRKDLSSLPEQKEGITIDGLQNLFQKKNSLLNKLLQKTKSKDTFDLLNTAFMFDGFFIHLSEGKGLNKPLHIINVIGNNVANPLVQPKNFIYLESKSSAEIIFEYVSNNNSNYFTNTVTDIVLHDNSNLNYYKIQNESGKAFHIEKTNIIQKDSSVLKHFSLSFGSEISRNNINVNIDGEYVENHLYGLYLGNKNQQIDNHTFIEHIKPNSISSELYKGILDDNAKGIFSGKILVRKEAQKTNAFQSNKSILLSSKAISDAKPQLEIYADDVKCSHGATVGKLDEDALFYIRSRGVRLELARSMLIRAFIEDIIKEISIEQLREKINHTIFQHLKRVEF